MGTTVQLWRECQTTFNIESGTLLWQSSHFPFRRVYVVNDCVYKVVASRYDTSNNLRVLDLAGEFAILKDCRGIPGIPWAIGYHKAGDFEALIMKRLPGKPLTSLNISWLRLLVILIKLGIIVLRLSWRGISHNDIVPRNILVTSKGSVSLTDFDQATRTKCSQALIRQFTGINIGGGKIHGSFITILKRYLKEKLSPEAIQFLRRLRKHTDN